MSYFGQFCANLLAILKTRGWIHGSYMSNIGQFCVNFVWIKGPFLKDGDVYLDQICPILVNFVPILCELFGDFDKRGLFSGVKYVIFGSFLCQFNADYLAIFKRRCCLLGSNMSYFGWFCANFVWIIWQFWKEGFFYLGQICHILVNFVQICWRFRNDGVVYLGHICLILVSFVPILCELRGDFEETGFFTLVI